MQIADAVTQESAGKSFNPDYTPVLDPDGLRGARIGVARKYFGFNGEVDRLMNEAIGVMEAFAGPSLIRSTLRRRRSMKDPKSRSCCTSSSTI